MDPSLDQEIVADSGHGESSLVQAPLAGVGASGSSAIPAGSSASRPADEQARVYWIWAVCCFLLLAVGLVFGQTVRHEFLGYDDDGFVFNNPHVTAGLTLSGLWYAMTDGPYGEWTPLSTLSHMLDCQLYGLNPAGHFLTNVLLHAASSVILFLVVLRMTGDLWPSAWVAAVFAIHPLHVESVAWLAEAQGRAERTVFHVDAGSVCALRRAPSLARYLTVAGCLGLGLMAKPMLVTVPFLLLLLDYWPLDRFRRAAGAVDRPQRARGSVACRSAGGWWWKKSPSWRWRRRVAESPYRSISRCGWPIDSTDCRSPRAWPMPWFRTQPIWVSRFTLSICRPITRIWVPTCRSPGLSEHWFCWWRSPRWPRTAGADGLICWSAGCGFWECWCQSSDWWEISFKPGPTAIPI